MSKDGLGGTGTITSKRVTTLQIYTARFPDQGMCGGGMIVIATSLSDAKKKLKAQFKLDGPKEDWHNECIDSLEEVGVIGQDNVIGFFID